MAFKYNSVLVVDDIPIDVFIHKTLLQKSGLVKVVCTATSVKSGLELIENLIALGQEHLVPSYIFLDVDMPYADGFQFLKTLKEMNVSKEYLKGVIVLSAGGYNVEREELNQNELFLEFIQKPLLAEHLTEL